MSQSLCAISRHKIMIRFGLLAAFFQILCFSGATAASLTALRDESSKLAKSGSSVRFAIDDEVEVGNIGAGYYEISEYERDMRKWIRQVEQAIVDADLHKCNRIEKARQQKYTRRSILIFGETHVPTMPISKHAQHAERRTLHEIGMITFQTRTTELLNRYETLLEQCGDAGWPKALSEYRSKFQTAFSRRDIDLLSAEMVEKFCPFVAQKDVRATIEGFKRLPVPKDVLQRDCCWW